MTTATFSLKGIPSVSIADARATLSELVGRARHAKSPTVLTSRGKPVAAMVSIEDLELVEEAIDQRLAADARTRIHRGEMPMSWEKAKAELSTKKAHEAKPAKAPRAK